MCIACHSQLSSQSVDEFTNGFVQMLNHAATSIMVSIGHRTGLFSAMVGMPPSTSERIASKTGLNERYVREWLGAMATARFVEVDQSGSLFFLTPVQATALAAAHSPSSLAHLAQYIGIIAKVEDPIVHCFHNGGGVPYSAFPRFHEVMAEDSSQTVVAGLLDHIIPLVPGLRAKLEKGIHVLDIGCGRGLALLQMAAWFPQSQFTGYDLSEAAIEYATNHARQRGLTNLIFQQRDLSNFHKDAEPVTFDLITSFDAIHDQARPDHVLAGIHRALRKDGIYLMQDIGAASNISANLDHPLAPLLYTLSCMHCMTVSLAQGGLGVGAMWGEELARQFLADAGFRSVERHILEHDIQNYYYIVRP